MICVQLQGGLGNQLFQYAAALSLADFHHTKVAFDLSFLKKQDMNQKHTLRQYALDIFDISVGQLTFWDEIILNIRSVPFQKTVKKILPPSGKWTIYSESSLLYDTEIQQSTSKNSYLTGYFQSEFYFKTIESKLRNTLQFKTKVKNHMADKIMECNSVSLHVRRGDYVINPDVGFFHGLCSLQYYQNAIHYIADRQSDPHFFIFSDDISWAREYLKLSFPAYFIEGSEAEDLQLMGLCKHNIIANSSFSWWGAWLNTHDQKIVISPKRWFADEKAESESSTIVPETWIRL